MKFYTYYQNNSGGSFDVDENVKEYVIIEAESYKQANERAEEIGIYFDGCETGMDCDCCGSRWYEVDESDADDEPMIFSTPANKADKGLMSKGCIIHYFNGTKEEIELK